MQFHHFWVGITAFFCSTYVSQSANLLADAASEKKKRHHKRNAVLKVAMVCPLNQPNFAANAADAAAGWEAWVNKTKGIIKTKGGKELKVQTTTIKYANGTLIEAVQKVSAGKYHLVIGCSTHYFGELVAALQAIKVPSIQCNAGNPYVWTKLAEIAKEDKVKLYGYGMHAPFTNYPLAYLKMAVQAFDMQSMQSKDEEIGLKDGTEALHLKPPLKIALVLGQSNQFTKSLCAAALKAARFLKLHIISGDEDKYTPFVSYENITDIAKQADILYGCTLLKDGMSVMKQISEIESSRRPRAVSLSVAPSKEEMFLDEFGKDAAYVSYPSQWHPDVQYNCDSQDEDDEYKCPVTFSSTESYVGFFKGSTPSYDRASCSAAGVALEVAALSLDADFTKHPLPDQRDLLHEALGDVETDSFFGSIEFDEETHMNSGLDVVIAQYQPTGDLGKVQSFAATKTSFQLRHAPPPGAGEEVKARKSSAISMGTSMMLVALFMLLLH
eukprot:gnl/MRDRNA2_/MRDRNA2_87921_c0_seq1.p1 gnl/MRDRNA2_/MRDRNA2_87921_c0~~gnl/MRDRNA2_/MRDRNA2_87921_c0_seq1.p1  ORF type:complete len:498 (-),score=100.74 gnl/MRDRNA2_/MRDRNA2_87921_c0_seq1:10-1503(-)